MSFTEAEVNGLTPPTYSDAYNILPQASPSLANTIPSLSLNPLLITKNSFTLSLYLLCSLALPLLLSTVALYTVLTNLSSLILSTCLNHFRTFLSTLSSQRARSLVPLRPIHRWGLRDLQCRRTMWLNEGRGERTQRVCGGRMR